MTPAELQTLGINAIRTIHPDDLTDATAAEVVIASTLDQVLAAMRQRHYPKPFVHRTLECMDQHWDWDDRGKEHNPEFCYRYGELCNGCGSETCLELPAILALVVP